MKVTTVKQTSFDQKVQFSGDSQKTLDDWTGGGYYDRLFSFELLGIKVVFWRKAK